VFVEPRLYTHILSAHLFKGKLPDSLDCTRCPFLETSEIDNMISLETNTTKQNPKKKEDNT